MDDKNLEGPEDEDENNLNSSEKKTDDDDSEISEDDKERLELLIRADQIKGQQLSIDSSGELFTEDEIKNLIFQGTHDPEKMHDLYYKGIDKLLRNYLPKGPEFQSAKDLIYEEKCCFLTRGHRKNNNGIRGADSRMGHIEDAEIMLNTVIAAVVNGRSYFEIYCILRDMNVERGYGLPKIETP